ncbi:MAG: translation initiation factor IF-2 [Parcubacteria group bacterium]|nr:translation initiation factor IF-2 [Parcubacteria group bacterium]
METQTQNLDIIKTEVRPPVVVVMGHVDHGKTTLLDAIRQTEVASGESGGITQSIGAYEVAHNGKKITFIDTPGHEAFFAMREHGVKVADVALLVVAADDGVRPQTKEVIKHILDAQVPFIVVINKIDKPGVVVEKVKKDLSDNGVLIEEWGGKVPVALISARDKKGIDELLDLILLVAEMEELKYNSQAVGEGYVIESHLDTRRGSTTTIIVTEGSLKSGDLLVCGTAYGPIKVMEDDAGKAITSAYPSKPVLVVGLSETPMVSEKCAVVDSVADAEDIIKEHKKVHAEFLEKIKIEPAGQPKTLAIVVKAAALGCLEALVNVLKQIKSDQVGLKLLKCDVGDITQSDIKKAENINAKVVGFRVKVNKEAVNYAHQRGVEIKTFEIIYDFVEGIKGFMTELLQPEVIKNEIGKIEILAVFRTEKPRMIVGGKITSGKLKKGAKFEIQRQGKVIGLGKITDLQKGKESADEVREGNEAGLQIESGAVIEVGDILTAFEEEKKYPEL